ncbi:MAG: type II secretion system F family protein [Candidatus Portnoybacteria bacterium]|nr:type II secretion system F family protein [Candidatus Portnoybacteria bacterium]
MPTYFYTAKSQDGKEKSGRIEAASERELAQQLRQGGYFLTFVAVEGGQESAASRKIFFRIFNSVPMVEKMIFARHLSTMIRAGLPMDRGLRVLSAQSKNPRFRQVLTEIERGIRGGKSFSVSLAEYPDVFPELFISMVRVGETTGRLDEVLMTLTIQMEKDYELRSKIRGAMVYPAIILSVMVAVGILMMVMVVPKLASAFQEMNLSLPLTTSIVIGVSQFLSNHLILGMALFVFIVVLIKVSMKTESGKKSLDFVFLNLPLISDLSRKINAALFARNFSAMVDAGVPINQALKIVANTMSNSFFRESLLIIAEGIQKGESLSSLLRQFSGLYPAMVVQMVEVGETTGSLSDTLRNLAEFYEQEINHVTKNLSTVIEPILMVIIGVAVGFFAISIIQPIYSLVGQM